MTTATLKETTKRTTGEWNAIVGGLVVDTIIVEHDAKGGPDSDSYRFNVLSDEDATGTDDRAEVRQMVADLIRDARNEAIEAQRDRDNDDLRDAIEALIDSGKAASALKALKAAGLA